jgi:hypothetical protein
VLLEKKMALMGLASGRRKFSKSLLGGECSFSGLKAVVSGMRTMGSGFKAEIFTKKTS